MKLRLGNDENHRDKPVPTILFLILSLFFWHVVGVYAQTECGNNFSYDFIEKNDSTIELCVLINGYSGKADYFTIKSENVISLPKFQGRYKDCLVFMLGYGQHFRLLTVFQVSNEKVIREDYEHTMCLEPNKKESYLFFYNGQPIKMTYNFENSKITFKKLRNKKKYSVFKGKTIVSCNNRFYVD